MKDLKKWFAAPEGSPSFDLDVESYEQAVKSIENNFRGSGEIRLLEVTYRVLSTTPHIVKTK